jgi:hypothetical protein
VLGAFAPQPRGPIANQEQKVASKSQDEQKKRKEAVSVLALLCDLYAIE